MIIQYERKSPFMPLSRLSPRSSRTGLARQRTANSEANDAQRHLHLWAAIRKTQQELAHWQNQINQVESLFNKHIVPRERQLTLVVTTQTEQLIRCFSNPELDIPDKSLLGLWIVDNLNSLKDHPFAETRSMETLLEEWRRLLSVDGPVENQLARLASRHNDESDSAQLFNDTDSGMCNESVSSARESAQSDDDHKHSTSFSQDIEYDAGLDNDRPRQYGNNANRQDNRSKNKPDDEHVADTINSLEDKLSVERLFRQLAKVLHPDREQDDEAKDAKHILMSECIAARKNNDISALLNLYCEHVGELPDDLNNNSHAELISALETQLKTLQTQLRQQRFGDPLKSMIVERYSASTSTDCERRIDAHAQSLDDEIASAQKLTKQLEDEDGLLDALDTRRAFEQDRMSINELTGM